MAATLPGITRTELEANAQQAFRAWLAGATDDELFAQANEFARQVATRKAYRIPV